jgi:hypothetical protein
METDPNKSPATQIDPEDVKPDDDADVPREPAGEPDPDHVVEENTPE